MLPNKEIAGSLSVPRIGSYMLMKIGCRNASPGMIDRLLMWLGYSPDLHSWSLYRRQDRHTVYYCRKCECGADEVRNAGPMGDGGWRDVNLPFKHKWEKDKFDKSEVLE